MIQNALGDIDVFRNVRTSEQLDIAKGGKPLPYDRYISMVMDVAASYAKTLQPSPIKANRIVDMLCHRDISSYKLDADVDFDVDHDPQQNDHLIIYNTHTQQSTLYFPQRL